MMLRVVLHALTSYLENYVGMNLVTRSTWLSQENDGQRIRPSTLYHPLNGLENSNLLQHNRSTTPELEKSYMEDVFDGNVWRDFQCNSLNPILAQSTEHRSPTEC